MSLAVNEGGSGGREATPAAPGASPGLLRRRYSVPETIMRKYRLAQQRSEASESGAATSASAASGGCGCGCGRRDRERVRRSALLRRLCGRAPGSPLAAAAAPLGSPPWRSLASSRCELRALSAGHDHAEPKRQRLDFRASDEMLRAAMRNSYERAEESRGERAAADAACRHRRAASSYTDTTDAFTDSESKFEVESDRNASTQLSERPSSEAATAEVKSEVITDAADSENSAHDPNPQIEDRSFTDTSDTFSTSMSTAKEANGNNDRKFAKQISKSAHIDGRISERSVSVDNDEKNVLPYDTPLTVDTPSYELLEIVVSETMNNTVPAIKSNAPENTLTQTLKALQPNHRLPPNMNIDEYVSNILVESLNSLTDQLECMNASIGSDRKINIVEKEIKVKLQNTGVNTIVHLSPTSNNQIIFGNEELCNSDERKDGCNNPQEIPDAEAIREELASVESNNNSEPRATTDVYYDDAPFSSLHHDNVNKAVLQQIQKLFQDELHNMNSDINFQVSSIPGVSHIEISNVDVYLDNHGEAPVGSNDIIEVHTSSDIETTEIISGVGTGNYFQDVEDNAVVPRFSAFPNTESMEVNTSSSDDAEVMGSDCTSLVDSLDDPNSPRSMFLRRSFNNNSNRRSDLVRSAIDVLDLLPENSSRSDSAQHREKGEAFFVRIKDNDCDCEKENVVVADHMPEKIKQRLYRRHRKRELRMECARRSRGKQLKRERARAAGARGGGDQGRAGAGRQLEREAAAVAAALLDDLIAAVVHDEYKCMRIKHKPRKLPTSKSDENVSKRTWRTDSDYRLTKDLIRTTREGTSHFIDKPMKCKKSDRHHIHGKLSLLTHPSSSTSPEERGPKRIYQKSEIHDGNKCIEILEILEYVNGSPSSPETTNSDENHNHRSKKSRIPIPVHERTQKTPKKSYSHKIHYSSAERLNCGSESGGSSQRPLLAAALAALVPAPAPASLAPAHASPAPPLPRPRSNSLRFRRVFDSIPEEKSSISVDSSTDDAHHARRASAPTLIDNINMRFNNSAIVGPPETVQTKESPKTTNSIHMTKETKSAGTSPLTNMENGKRAQRLKSQTTMTSPSRRSAATSPIQGPCAPAGADFNQATGAAGSAGASGPAGAAGPVGASGKRGLASRGRAWLGFTRPGHKLDEGIALACASPLLSHRTPSVSVE